MQLSAEHWNELGERLRDSSFFAAGTLIEGTSWRPNAFRRFQIGRLPDGQEEWLEFWRTNHLLPPYEELFARHEEGVYGGRSLCFISLADLIRRKETERRVDWEDVEKLEEFLDARNLAHVGQGKMDLASALAQLRSRRGLETCLKCGHFRDAEAIGHALEQTHLSITQAFLLPFLPEFRSLPKPTVPMEPVVLRKLQNVPPGSGTHLGLIEIARRQYMTACQAADRADKDAIRASQR